jgi:uncharacterized protein (TIGR02466 family)
MKSKSKNKTNNQQQDQLEALIYFPTLVYKAMKPEFLKAAGAVCEEAVQEVKDKGQELNEIYPVHMTGQLYDDPRMAPLCQFIGESSWNILQAQGYNMAGLNTFFQEMWCQEHFKHSAMEQHVHGYGCQIVGFYFVEVPENSSRVVLHDPKPGKVQAGLFETNAAQVTPASNMVNFQPEAGMVLFMNSWLPHSFTRHSAESPMSFIHFNLSVRDAPQACPIPVPPCIPAAEVI